MRVGSLWRCAAGRVETFGYVPCSLTSNESSNAPSDFVRHIRPRKSRGRNGSVIARCGGDAREVNRSTGLPIHESG